MQTSVHLDKHKTDFGYNFFGGGSFKGSPSTNFFILRVNQLNIFLSPEQMIDLAKVVNKAVKEIES
jgi:predicted proteasome-type protease